MPWVTWTPSQSCKIGSRFSNITSIYYNWWTTAKVSGMGKPWSVHETLRKQNLMMSSGLVFQKALYASSEPMAVFSFAFKEVRNQRFLDCSTPSASAHIWPSILVLDVTLWSQYVWDRKTQIARKKWKKPPQRILLQFKPFKSLVLRQGHHTRRNCLGLSMFVEPSTTSLFNCVVSLCATRNCERMKPRRN